MAITRITNIASTIPDDSIANEKLSDIVNFKNTIINGDMSIAQRGQQTGLATGYTECDRFALYNSGTSVQFTTDQDTSVPSGQNFSKSLKLTLTTADSSITGSNEVQLYQNIEAQNLQYLGFGTSSAKAIVLSFWVKSSVAGDYVLWVYKPDTTGRQIAKLYNIASADTWQKVTFEIPADTDSGATIANDNGTGLSIVWQLAAGSDWTSGTLPTSWENLVNANRYVGQNNTFIGTTNATFFLTGVQLEAGSVASDFEFLPFDVNLNRCQRYFVQYGRDLNGGADINVGIGQWYSASEIVYNIYSPVRMRVKPTITSPTVSGGYRFHKAGSYTDVDTGGVMTNCDNQALSVYKSGLSGGTGGQATFVAFIVNGAKVQFSAEL